MKIGVCGIPDNFKSCCIPEADFAEISLKDLADKTDEELKALIQISKQTGVPIETANCFFPGEFKLCGKDYSKNTVLEYSKKVLDKAAQLGVELAVIGSGKSRNIDEGEDKEKCLAQLEECFITAADQAGKYGIDIVLEPLNKKETNYLNTVAQAGAVVRKIAHPNLFLLADTYHMSLENDPYQSLIDFKDILRHMHIARGITRKFPMPDDGFDYAEIKTMTDKAGYHLRIAIEGVPYNDFDSEIVGCVNFVKDIFGR